MLRTDVMLATRRSSHQEAQLTEWHDIDQPCSGDRAQTELDESLIGGYAAYVDGRVYDFSYAAQLQTMKQKLS